MDKPKRDKKFASDERGICSPDCNKSASLLMPYPEDRYTLEEVV